MAKHALRTFFALQLSKSLRERCEHLSKQLQSTMTHSDEIRWLPPQHLHMTLKFLGATRADDVPPIIESISSQLVNLPAICLTTSILRLNPQHKHPHTIILECEPEPQLSELVARLNQVSDTFGFSQGSRPFLPHITLARLPQHTHIFWGLPTSIVEAQQPRSIPEPCDTVIWYQSIQQEYGMRYEPIAKWSLVI